MVIFKLYKDVREEDLVRTQTSSKQDFARWFATNIGTSANCKVTGNYLNEQIVLSTEEDNQEALAQALDERGLSSIMAYV